MLELPTAWPYVPRLSPASTATGKLETPGTADQVSGGDFKVQTGISVSPLGGGYKLCGVMGGVSVSMLLDTGAAVTLLRKDVWDKMSDQSSELQPWSEATLVSAGGTPSRVSRLKLQKPKTKFTV